jgi:hypothetical protein
MSWVLRYTRDHRPEISPRPNVDVSFLINGFSSSSG